MNLFLLAIVVLISCFHHIDARSLSLGTTSTSTSIDRVGSRTTNDIEMKIKQQKLCDKICSLKGGSSGIGSFDWRYFAAGGICAAWSHGITTPLDVIKTRMQAYPELYTHGVWHAAKDIVAKNGIAFLLAGLGPTLVGYGLEGALKFGFYEAFKILFILVTSNQFINSLLASVVAGAIASIVLCPMEEARIKMVGERDWAKENVVSSIARLIREDGLLASFKGLYAMLSKQIPYTMGKQVSFDFITKLFYKLSEQLSFNTSDAYVKMAISIFSAFLTSVVACLFSQPGDVILTNTYSDSSHGHSSGHSNNSKTSSDKNSHSTDFNSIVTDIYRKHGLSGFYLGLQARLAHVASIITSQLVVYDVVKSMLGLPVTGSH